MPYINNCPFCYEAERLWVEHDCGARYVECGNCGAKGPVFFVRNDDSGEMEERAIVGWNEAAR